MLSSTIHFLKNNTWLAIFLFILPVILYILVFNAVSLNVNYVAFDDILILGVIPGFGESSWPEKWKRLTELFPEHRLVFSRSIILLLQNTFGRLDLVWAMMIANFCWAACAFVFYKAFKRLKLSLWYFVPIMWLWFNIQSFENIFWGVSSLCNFGVLLFVITSFYFAAFYPKRIYYALPFAIIATFSYGNGLMAFPVIALLCLLSGQRVNFFITLVVMAAIASIYFVDFKPITQNLDISDPHEVKEGIMGFFGFIGSISTLYAYPADAFLLIIAVTSGVLMLLALLWLTRTQWAKWWKAVVQNKPYSNQVALFAVALALFIAVTSLALSYKRIPTDHFEGMFKGRYRMYSTLACVAIYFAFLSLTNTVTIKKYLPTIVLATIVLNLVILHSNFADAINNRRLAICQEFNARYNADWLGTRMFSMDRNHIEKIRAYYGSEDPLAEQWTPSNLSVNTPCEAPVIPVTVNLEEELIRIKYNENTITTDLDYSDGAYILLKSKEHTYFSPFMQYPLPLKTTLRRFLYFSKDVHADFHSANVEPGIYDIYFVKRVNGLNRIYCTNKTWQEK